MTYWWQYDIFHLRLLSHFDGIYFYLNTLMLVVLVMNQRNAVITVDKIPIER